MRKHMFILALCLSFMAGSKANADPLSKTDWLAEGAFGLLLAQDYRQTMDIRRAMSDHVNGWNDWHETNPLLGRNPSDARIRNYFLAAAIVHPIITFAMPKGAPRLLWQGSTITLEIAVTAHNARIGLRGVW